MVAKRETTYNIAGSYLFDCSYEESSPLNDDGHYEESISVQGFLATWK